MLERPAFLVSRELPTSCEDECKEIILKKRLAKGTEVASEEERSSRDSGDHSLSKVSLLNGQTAGLAQSDSSSLISKIGRDLSINCLLKCPRSEYGSIATLNSSFRSLVRTGEIYSIRRQLGIKEFWVYFSCQALVWNAFDPINLKWMHLPPINTTSYCFMYSNKESLAVGTELLVIGMEIDSKIIYRYSILTNSWSEARLMNEARCLFGSASVGEIGIVAGGCDQTGKALASAEMYNAATGSWETLPSMNTPRKKCSGVFLDDKFYAIGGIGVDETSLLTSAEAYDMVNRTWVEIPNMFPANNERASWEAPPLLADVKNNLYAAFHDEHELRKYDKVRNSWVTLGRLPERAASMGGWGLAFRACGDMLVVIGGPRSQCHCFVEVNGWVPDEGPPQWRFLGRKDSHNFVYNCAVMGC